VRLGQQRVSVSFDRKQAETAEENWIAAAT
jgi:hypothetical protein